MHVRIATTNKHLTRVTRSGLSVKCWDWPCYETLTTRFLLMRGLRSLLLYIHPLSLSDTNFRLSITSFPDLR